MKTELIHTPEGVRDIYGDEYARKLKIQECIAKQIHLYGYQDIQTPSFEYLEVFGKEIGTTPIKELFKFFDSDGNILCLRPDFTPSIARCGAKYFSGQEGPLRFTYLGNTFSNTTVLQGKLRETTQLGAELIGDDSVWADGEMIGMLADALTHTGLREFQISIGEADYFKGICQEFSFTREEEEQVRDYISNKNFFGAKEYLEYRNKPKKVIETIMCIEDLFGSPECLERAKQLSAHPLCLKAIDRLSGLYAVLTAYEAHKYVSFDLGMLSSYHYYTGIIFKVYTHGIGDVIVKGGRYDKLLPYFGKNSPAIGFVIVIDDLMQALERQNITIDLEDNKVTLFYTPYDYEEVLKEAFALRRKGKAAVLLPSQFGSRMEKGK